MTAFNVVKFKVKAGQTAAFLAAHDGGKAKWPGLVKGSIVKTGERDFCLIGEWESQAALASARPAMIETLNSFREHLDELGDGRGVTDAVAGDAVLSF